MPTAILHGFFGAKHTFLLINSIVEESEAIGVKWWLRSLIEAAFREAITQKNIHDRMTHYKI